jgi:hypothetical protein
MQRQAIQTITKSHYNANASPLFKELKILPFQELFLHLANACLCIQLNENIADPSLKISG